MNPSFSPPPPHSPGDILQDSKAGLTLAFKALANLSKTHFSPSPQLEPLDLVGFLLYILCVPLPYNLCQNALAPLP